jgi:hypothetical protein
VLAGASSSAVPSVRAILRARSTCITTHEHEHHSRLCGSMVLHACTAGCSAA